MASFELVMSLSLYSPRYFCGVSGSRRENTCAVVSSALSSSVSRVMRSASWSPQTCTHSPHPLHRSDTKIENRPPSPGVLASTVRKIAGTLLYASGSLSMMPVNSARDCSVMPAMAAASSRTIVLKGTPLFAFTDSFMRVRARCSSAGSSLSRVCRSPPSRT